MNNKKSLTVTIISVFLVSLGLVSSFFINEVLAERLISIFTTITAIIGAVALFYQFKRDKNLNEANFLVEYSHQFYDTYKCADLMNELETCRIDPTYKLDVEGHYKQIVGYLEWLETLCSLIQANVLQIEKIDNVMGYRYFLIVNNKQVQNGELTRNREFYRSIYALYPIWVKYKKKHNLSIIFEENDLSKTEGFQDIVSTTKK